MWDLLLIINTLRPRQNGRHFPYDIFKWILLYENVWISVNISLKFVLRGPSNNIPTLVRVMTWRRPGDKPLSGQMMVRLPPHICVTWPQWVNAIEKVRVECNIKHPYRLLTHLTLVKMVAISTDGNFRCMNEKFCIWTKISSLFLKVRLTIAQHWFRQLVPSHYLNQCWPSSPTHIYGTEGGWVSVDFMECGATTPLWL